MKPTSKRNANGRGETSVAHIEAEMQTGVNKRQAQAQAIDGSLKVKGATYAKTAKPKVR